jgi:hypothetical protein
VAHISDVERADFDGRAEQRECSVCRAQYGRGGPRKSGVVIVDDVMYFVKDVL